MEKQGRVIVGQYGSSRLSQPIIGHIVADGRKCGKAVDMLKGLGMEIRTSGQAFRVVETKSKQISNN